MRAASAFMAGVGSAAIVALGWQAGVGTLVQALPQSQAAASGTNGSASNSTSSASPSASASATTSTDTSSASASASPTQATSGATDGTYTGSAVQTRYGVVQVQVVIAGGAISDVVAVQANATSGRQQAFPLLREEALSAQSANISNISGATYTTMGYSQSMQSALDQAGYTG